MHPNVDGRAPQYHGVLNPSKTVPHRERKKKNGDTNKSPRWHFASVVSPFFFLFSLSDLGREMCCTCLLSCAKHLYYAVMNLLIYGVQLAPLSPTARFMTLLINPSLLQLNKNALPFFLIKLYFPTVPCAKSTPIGCSFSL